MKQIKIVFINNNKVLYYRMFSNNYFPICLKDSIKYLTEKQEGKI